MPDNCGNGKVIDTYLQKGRDYIVDQGPKSGWTPYPYPHPLRSQLGGGGDPSPSPTPTPTPSEEASLTYIRRRSQLQRWFRYNAAFRKAADNYPAG